MMKQVVVVAVVVADSVVVVVVVMMNWTTMTMLVEHERVVPNLTVVIIFSLDLVDSFPLATEERQWWWKTRTRRHVCDEMLPNRWKGVDEMRI